MPQYIGLDESLKDTLISIRENGKRIWRGKCPSDPKLVAEAICKRAPNVERVVFKTGPLSVWFDHAMTAEGGPAICIDARHAKAALDMAPNKTDPNDADGLAHLAEVGFFGVVTASSFIAAIEDLANFAKSRSVGAWIGLTTRRYQSGEVDYDGHISRCGDNHLRSLLYEAAMVILTRVSAASALRNWGLRLKEKIGFKRAAVAVARKMAGIMHAMLKSGELFDRSVKAAA